MVDIYILDEDEDGTKGSAARNKSYFQKAFRADFER